MKSNIWIAELIIIIPMAILVIAAFTLTIVRLIAKQLIQEETKPPTININKKIIKTNGSEQLRNVEA